MAADIDVDNIVLRLEKVVTWHRGTQKKFVQDIIDDLKSPAETPADLGQLPPPDAATLSKPPPFPVADPPL